MITISIFDHAGGFAENKDTARELRLKSIIPALEENGEVILDFAGVGSATQSFVHAMISDIMRKYGSDVLERIEFKNCNENVREIISIVVDYMQQAD